MFGVLVALEAQTLKLGRISRPEPGFFPFWLGIALVILGAVLAVSSRRGTAAESEGSWKELKWEKIVYSLVSVLAYAFLLQPLGFLISTFILMFLLFRVVGDQKWFVVAAGSVITSLVTYLLFRVWLQVQLPSGLLGV